MRPLRREYVATSEKPCAGDGYYQFGGWAAVGPVEKFFDQPALKVIRNSVSTFNAVVALATALSVVISAIFLLVISLPVPGQLALLAVSPTLLSVALAAVTSSAAKRLPTVDYRIEKLIGTLSIAPVGEHHRYSNERTQVVKFVKNGVRLVEIHSFITGRSTNPRTVEVIKPNHVLLDGKVPEEDGRNHRWVYLGRAYHRGQSTEIGIRQQFEDDIESMRPFYGEGGGGRRVGEMVVTLKFDRSDEPPEIEAMTWNSRPRPGQPEATEHLKYERTLNVKDGIVEFVLRVQNPRRFYRYGFRWNWSSP